MNQITYAVDPETVLPDVEKIIFQLAHRFSNTYPITYDECLSEGYLAFMKACMDYKPDRKTKFSSWVYYWVWTKLKDLVMKRSKEPLDFIEIDEEHLGEAAPTRPAYLDFVEDLSYDARDIIQMLVETPKELLSVATTPKQLLNKIKEHMVERHGYKPSEVNRAVEEIRLVLQEEWGQNVSAGWARWSAA